MTSLPSGQLTAATLFAIAMFLLFKQDFTLLGRVTDLRTPCLGVKYICYHLDFEAKNQHLSKIYAVAQIGMMCIMLESLCDVFWPVLCGNLD